ncbi:hypothetical protein V1512DRAFT_254190 [Lipomyces arxii]|uniref:uncharacterized protein n=1 Tax=Lipomyces arxii TaxID=56418 RepID=UPI0034CF8F66
MSKVTTKTRRKMRYLNSLFHKNKILSDNQTPESQTRSATIFHFITWSQTASLPETTNNKHKEHRNLASIFRRSAVISTSVITEQKQEARCIPFHNQQENLNTQIADSATDNDKFPNNFVLQANMLSEKRTNQSVFRQDKQKDNEPQTKSNQLMDEKRSYKSIETSLFQQNDQISDVISAELQNSQSNSECSDLISRDYIENSAEAVNAYLTLVYKSIPVMIRNGDNKDDQDMDEISVIKDGTILLRPEDGTIGEDTADQLIECSDGFLALNATLDSFIQLMAAISRTCDTE